MRSKVPFDLDEERKKAPVEAGIDIRRSVPQPWLPSMRTCAEAPPKVLPSPGADTSFYRCQAQPAC